MCLCGRNNACCFFAAVLRYELFQRIGSVERIKIEHQPVFIRSHGPEAEYLGIDWLFLVNDEPDHFG